MCFVLMLRLHQIALQQAPQWILLLNDKGARIVQDIP